MIENQVCVADNPKTHTTKFKWLKDLPLSETDKNTLGQFLENQENRITALENEIKKIKSMILKQNVAISKVNLK